MTDGVKRESNFFFRLADCYSCAIAFGNGMRGKPNSRIKDGANVGPATENAKRADACA